MNAFLNKDFRSGSLFFFPSLIVLIAILLACRSEDRPVQETEPTPEPSVARTSEVEEKVKEDTLPAVALADTLRIIGVGDMMLGSNYPSASYLPPNGGKDMLAEVEGILKGADVTFGNLEGTLIEKGTMSKHCNDPSKCYAFRSPESYADHFLNAGFDLLSMANNHSGDFGPEGRRRTKELLKEHGIRYAGLAGTDETAVFEKDGIKYGFCAFAPNTGTCDIRDLNRAKQIVSKLAETNDIVIVSFHGGAEGVKNQRVPKKTEIFYGEDRGNVHAFAHAVIDAGADIVFGHGPHVTRAMELYKDRFIIYSMGNFCTYGRFNLRDEAGYAPIVQLEVDKTGAFLAGNITPIYQEKTHGPKVDPKKRVIHKLIELTNADFPDTPLEIQEDGRIIRK